MPIPECPEALPQNLRNLVAKFGEGWAECTDRPRPTSATCKKWEELLGK